MGSRHSLPIATSPSDRRAMRLACPGSLRSQHLSFTLPSAVLTLQVCWQTDDPRLVDPTGGGKLAAGLVPRRRRALDCSGSYGCPSIAPCGRGHCEKEERESCQPNASLKKKKKRLAAGRLTMEMLAIGPAPTCAPRATYRHDPFRGRFRHENGAVEIQADKVPDEGQKAVLQIASERSWQRAGVQGERSGAVRR